MTQSVDYDETFVSSIKFIFKLRTNIVYDLKCGINMLNRLKFCRFGYEVCSHPIINSVHQTLMYFQ